MAPLARVLNLLSRSSVQLRTEYQKRLSFAEEVKRRLGTWIFSEHETWHSYSYTATLMTTAISMHATHLIEKPSESHFIPLRTPHYILVSVAWCTSHTRTVVQECSNCDEASQWKRPKIDLSPRQNPLTDLHQNWHAWLYVMDGTRLKKCHDRFVEFCSVLYTQWSRNEFESGGTGPQRKWRDAIRLCRKKIFFWSCPSTFWL